MPPKALTDIFIMLCRDFNAGAVPLSSQLFALLLRHLPNIANITKEVKYIKITLYVIQWHYTIGLPLYVQIGFVTSNDTGNIVHTSVIKNFVSNNLNHVEARLGGNGIHKHVAMYICRLMRAED